MKWFSISLFTFLFLVVALFGVQHPERIEKVADNTGRFFDALGAAVILAIQGLILLLFVFAAVAILWAIAKVYAVWADRIDRNRRAENGLFPLIEYSLPGGAKGYWNPNNSFDDFVALSPKGFYAFSNPEYGADRRLAARLAQEEVNKVRAMFPGDYARMDKYGSESAIPKVPAWAKRSAEPKAYLPVVGETPVGPIYEGQVAPTLVDGVAALKVSRPDSWVVGQESGRNTYACYRPAVDVHAAVVGATGSGKTKSVGMLMALNALQCGDRLVILDADDGIDWKKFSSHAEWHQTDAHVFIDQIAAILEEKNRRIELLARLGIDHIGADPSLRKEFPRTFVFIEEYGSLLQSFGNRRSAAKRVNDMLDELMRKARKVGLHFVFFDQYPDLWPDQTLVNAKTKYVFAIDGGKGAKVSAPKAANLDVGQFYLRDVVYRGFDVSVQAPMLLNNMARPDAPLLIDGSVRTELTPTSVYEMSNEESAPEWESIRSEHIPFPNNASKKDVIFYWRDRNPTGTQAEFRAWLASHNQFYARGYISDVFAEWEAAKASDKN